MKGHSIGSVDIAHVAVEVHAPYDRFTGALEKTAGRFDKEVKQDMHSNPRRAEKRIKAMGAQRTRQ
jgi:hypothetical protein